MSTTENDINKALQYARAHGYSLLRVILTNKIEDVHIHNDSIHYCCISAVTCLEGNSQNSGFTFRTYFPYSICPGRVISILTPEDKNVYMR